ncbi:unnamed protein product [Mesocestoides corti]|uniref:Rubicon Homology domain-containing protein n=1 Tax=Mesocestoides corti TaxID=53468 RepID=A0A3P6HAI8_MESCO|nr:unnamed protein product [Mesocestoides corti]
MDAGIQLSVHELDEYVQQCKRMYLTSHDKPQAYQKFLLKRLVELRRLLHNMKEREHHLGMYTDVQSPTEVAPSASPTIVKGHTFHAISALRLLWKVCESCCRSVKSPAGSVLLCRACSVACHDSPACVRGLLRSCPASTIQTVEASKLSYLGASLSKQSWHCWSCRVRLRPPQLDQLPSRTVSPHDAFSSHHRHSPPSAEMLESIRRLEHASTAEKFNLKCLSKVMEEVAGLYSSKLGPVLTHTDARVVASCVQEAGPTDTSPAQLCYYSGKFFCANCHWGDLWQIPANIFTLGVTTPHPVSRDAFISLEYMWSRQKFRAPEAWHRWNPQAVLAGSLRVRGHRLLETYFRVCGEAAKYRGKLEESQPTWLLEEPFVYTMWTVEQVLDGSLISLLEELLQEIEDHVNACVVSLSNVNDDVVICMHSCDQLAAAVDLVSTAQSHASRPPSSTLSRGPWSVLLVVYCVFEYS